MKANEVTVEESKELIEKLFELRKKCAEDKKFSKEFLKMQELCAKKFDYLVEYRTRRYKGFANYEDLYQEGRLALYSALKSYDPEKGDFFWWSNKYIKTKLSREANRHSTIQIPLKKANTMTPHKVSRIPIMADEADDAFEIMKNEEFSNIVKEALSNLPRKQRRVIELHFEVGNKKKKNGPLSIGNICKKLKISRMNCIQLLNDAKIALHQELSEALT